MKSTAREFMKAHEGRMNRKVIEDAEGMRLIGRFVVEKRRQDVRSVDEKMRYK